MTTAESAPRKGVAIVGFAPSWPETPWEAPIEIWGLNRLHALTDAHPKARFTRWFQLHDLRDHHSEDDEHLNWLRAFNGPVYQWPSHVAKYGLPNGAPYPKEAILNYFKPYPYFTNSISWMIALAIAEAFDWIGIYGVDMAQDGVLNAEYSHQRPSCEWLVGWAQGKGIQVDIPETSDLMKTAYLYGVEGGASPLHRKMMARRDQLITMKQQHDQQLAAHQQASLQVAGALEDVTYFLRTWMNPLEGPKT